MKEMKKSSIVFGSCFAISLLGSFIMPKTGRYVLWDEFFDVAILCIIVAYMIYRLVVVIGRKIIRNIIIVGGIILCVLFVKNTAIDMFSGTEEIYLTDVSVSRYQGPSGIISLHYYLQGTDNEEKTKRLEISSQEYEQYKNIRNVYVEYYPRTKRVVQIRIGE